MLVNGRKLKRLDCKLNFLNSPPPKEITVEFWSAEVTQQVANSAAFVKPAAATATKMLKKAGGKFFMNPSLATGQGKSVKSAGKMATHVWNKVALIASIKWKAETAEVRIEKIMRIELLTIKPLTAKPLDPPPPRSKNQPRRFVGSKTRRILHIQLRQEGTVWKASRRREGRKCCRLCRSSPSSEESAKGKRGSKGKG